MSDDKRTYVFSGEAQDRVKALASRCKLSTGSNVLRLALKDLEDLLDAVDRGATIIIREGDGAEKPWHPLLEPDDSQVKN